MMKGICTKKALHYLFLIITGAISVTGLLTIAQIAHGQVSTEKADSLLQLAIKANDKQQYH